MQTIHFTKDLEVSVQGSPWALILYQREFSDENGKADFYEDFNESFKKLERSDVIDVPFFLQAVWAMAKNADDDIPPFDEWARSLDFPMDVNAEWLKEAQSAIIAEIFRGGSSDDQEEPNRKAGTGRRTDRRADGARS